MQTVRIGGRVNQLQKFISDTYMEHNPSLSDGLPALQHALAAPGANSEPSIRYEKLHRVLAEGNFALSVGEGRREGIHTSFYDLFRIEGSKIVEHWDTTEKIAPRSEWKNDNGKC